MTKTLYERLGGFDGITRLVDDVVDAHFANPLIKTRFEKTADIRGVPVVPLYTTRAHHYFGG